MFRVRHLFKHLVGISQRPFSRSSSTSLVKGCDYEHWLVVMNPPMGYPQRDEIITRYINTLALALGSEEEAKSSIYSVSTKYYFAFGCNVSEKLVHKIKSLPDVKWVLPDSYLNVGVDNYGGSQNSEVDAKLDAFSRTGYVLTSVLEDFWISIVSLQSTETTGEPFVDGKVLPYEEKYHADWLRDKNNLTGTNQGR